MRRGAGFANVAVVDDHGELLTKQEIIAVLRRLHIPDDTVQAIAAELPDRVDRAEAANICGRYGITLDWAMSARVGSP